MAEDSYATIGLTGPAVGDPMDPSLVEDDALSTTISSFFTDGSSNSLIVDTEIGATWYVLNTASNGYPDENNRVLIAQITSPGNIFGSINYRVFTNGIYDDENSQHSFDFNGVGTFYELNSTNQNPLCGCTDEASCNYDPNALTTTVLVSNMMSVKFVTVLELSTSVDVLIYLKGTVIVTETS